MAVGYLKENFAFGTLASTLNAAAATLTMTAGHSLPTASGSFQLVIWDAATYPNPSDDPNVEIVTGSFDTGNAYDITRAQESTSDVEHAAGDKVGLHYTAGVNVDDLDAANHTIALGVGSPTVDNVQAYLDNTGSSGYFTGGILSDGGSGTLDVSAGEGFIRTTDDDNAPLLSFKFSGTTGLAIPDNTTRYVFVNDSGTINLSADEFIEAEDNIMLGVVTDEGGAISHAFNTGVRLEESIGQLGRYIRHVDDVVRNKRKGGLIFGQSGDANRYVTITAGQLEWGRTGYPFAAYNTSGADTFDTYSANGQEATGVSAWPNAQWDDGGTLTNLGNNKWAVLWWYIEPDGHVVLVYGRTEHGTEGAAEEEEQPSSSLPNRISSASVIASKFIFKESEDIAAKIETAFGTPFTGAGVTAHQNLANLDFATAGHTGFQEQGDVLDDLNTLTAATVDGQLIVATGAGAFAYESGATLRTSIGVGTGDTLTLTGLTTTGQISSAVGAEGAPGYVFTGQLDDGMWSPAAGKLAWSLGGSEAIRLDGTGLGIGTNAPGHVLDVRAVVNAYGLRFDATGAGGGFASYGSSQGGIIGSSVSGGSFPFDQSGNLVIASRTNGTGRSIALVTGATPTVRVTIVPDGNVGIFTTNPQGTLSIGNITEGGTAGLNIQTSHETHTLTLGSTSVTTTIDIPSGALLLGASFCVNTAVTDTGGDDTWTAAFSGGDSTSLGGGAPAQNTKVNTTIPPAVAGSETNITFTPNAGNFGAGVIEIVAYYIDLTSLANV